LGREQSVVRERSVVSSHIFKKSDSNGDDGVCLHVFEKIQDRRVRRRRAEDREAAGGFEEGYRKGFEDGKKIGLEEGLGEARVLCGGLQAILEEIGAFKGALFNECEKEAVNLCINIAKKVVQRELDMREDSVVFIVKEALNAAVTNGKIKVRLNTADMEIIMGLESELEKFTKGFAGVEFVGDSEVGRGGCIVETGTGEVDATIEGLFEEIEGLLKGN